MANGSLEMTELNQTKGHRSLTSIRCEKLRWWLPRRNVFLSDKVVRALCVYFDNYHDAPVDSFDCYAFACMYAGVKSVPKEYSRWRNISNEPPRPGDVVFLLRNTSSGKRFVHATVMIDTDLTISVMGAGGQIEFTRLSESIEDFNADDVQVVMPVKE